MKHQHYNVIVAYLNGETIERIQNNEVACEWTLSDDGFIPSFSPVHKWRIKHKDVVEVKYYRSNCLDDGFTLLGDAPDLVKWDLKITYTNGKISEVTHARS